MNSLSKLALVLTFCTGMIACSGGKAVKGDYGVVPLPQEVTLTNGNPFVLSPSTKIFYPEGNDKMKKNAEFLASYIKEITGYELATATGQPGKGISLVIDQSIQNPEGYQLTVSDNGIRIAGSTDAGVFYGIQTLRKSIPATAQGMNVELPAATINDYPRFAYRGMMLDVSRHFFPVDSVKTYLDILALHNQNTFHWHLSDDQGWRIEIKKYPELTQIGSKRKETVIGHNSGTYDGKEYGGFYTQDQIRDVINYAAERHITIIPEIDMPGHQLAALATYPELGCTGGPYDVWGQWGVADDVICAGNEKSMQFLEDVLSEVIDLFPSEYIHVGGDECPKVRWEKCPKCQARIKELGLKADKDHTAEQRLQSYIINYAEQFLNGKGRQIIGWEEILEGGLAPNATVMSWRGIEGGIEAVKHKHDAIMTPSSFLYFDYYQTMDTDNEPPAIGGYVPLEKVYSYEPVPQILTPEEAKHIVGIQANLWTEYIPTYSQVEYMELPRMAALSEVQWTMPEKKEYADFLKRLPGLIAVYDINQYNYAKHIFQVNSQYIPDTEANVLNVALSTIDNAPVYYTLDGSDPTASSNIYTDTLKIGQSCTLKAITIRPNGSSAVLKEDIKFNKATMKPITMQQPINEKYKFEGKNTLIDGLAGSRNYRTGRWIAFYQNDLEAVIDLQHETPISKAWVRTYVEIGEEILDLRELSVAVSNDGKEYKEVKSEVYPAVSKEDKNGIYTHELSFDTVQARYVKITARPEYNLPAWHWGKGRPAFIFVDEIGLE